MTSRIDLCVEALRPLARSSELEATRLMTAEPQIREFQVSSGSTSASQRAALEELDSVIVQEAELRSREASFWQGVRDYIAQRMAILDFDEG
jgi:hypothetical protein